MRKVFFITNSLTRGGLRTLILTQADWLLRNGYQPHVLLLHRPPQDAEVFSFPVTWLGRDGARPPASAKLFYALLRPLVKGLGNIFQAGWLEKKIRQMLAQQDCADQDLIVIHGFTSILGMRQLQGSNVVAVMNEMESHFLSGFPAWVRALRRALVNFALEGKKVVAVSQAVRKDFHTAYGDVHQVEVIYNGLDPELIKHAEAEKRQFVPDRPYIVSVGRLEAVKDFASLLKAFQLAVPEEIDLVVVGDGDERCALEKLSEELGISDRVHFAGYVREPYDILRGARLFVSSSLHEGFGLAILEAMCLGVPVISTATGGAEEIMRESFDFLVPPGRPDLLAEKLRWFFSGQAVGLPGQVFNPAFHIATTMGKYLALVENREVTAPVENTP